VNYLIFKIAELYTCRFDKICIIAVALNTYKYLNFCCVFIRFYDKTVVANFAENNNNIMDIMPNKVPAPGWKGGFLAQHPEMNYPNVNLDALSLTGNLDNIGKITRQQRALWPEFSWETQKDQPNPKRCYQMFAPDISRVGYDDIGQSWSIICPQQGTFIQGLGAMNVEVTVTGQKGWVDETNKSMAVDMIVKPKIWFSPSAKQSPTVRLLWALFDLQALDFPSEKSRAIQINTFKTAQQTQRIISIRDGLFMPDTNPSFTDHSQESWSHANVEVEIGPIDVNPHPVVDEFNHLVMNAFNLASGNMLQIGNTLAWNVWFDAPSLVDENEWRYHADKWRKSIDADHGSPDGNGTAPRYADGQPFNVEQELIAEAVQDIINFLKKYFAKYV